MSGEVYYFQFHILAVIRRLTDASSIHIPFKQIAMLPKELVKIK